VVGLVDLSQQKRRLLGRLRNGKSRKREGLVLVEGVRAVKEAIDTNAEVRFVVASERIESTTAGLALAEHIRKENLDITSVSEKELAALADTKHPQGILMVCKEQQMELPDILRVGGSCPNECPHIPRVLNAIKHQVAATNSEDIRKLHLLFFTDH
jgi:TrmH family RNA methyltransferase